MDEDSEETQPIFRNRTTKEATFLFYNTLTGLVKALEGKYTVIDLRNEGCVTGKITFVDAKMNIEMEDVVFYDPRGTEHIFSNFYVSKRNIRYVHLPKKTSALELIDKQFEKMQPQKRVRDEHTFKKSRAKKYNEEIIQSAFGEGTSTT